MVKSYRCLGSVKHLAITLVASILMMTLTSEFTATVGRMTRARYFTLGQETGVYCRSCVFGCLFFPPRASICSDSCLVCRAVWNLEKLEDVDIILIVGSRSLETELGEVRQGCEIGLRALTVRSQGLL